MRLMIQQFVSLTGNTFLDIIRQPIVLLLTTTSIALTGLLPVVSIFMFGEEARLVRDGALALHFVFGLLLAGVSASAALYREISRGTAAAVLCKPVSRSLFFLAKYSGVALVLCLFSAISLMATLLSVRMTLPGLDTDWRVGAFLYAAIPAAFFLAAITNFILKRPVVSQAFAFLIPCLCTAFVLGNGLSADGHFIRFGSLMPWPIVPAGVLINMTLAVMAAMALSLSTRLPPVFTLPICIALFFLGLLSDYLWRETRHLFVKAADHSLLAAAGYRLLPNWQDFWMADTLAVGGTIPWSYVVGAGAYALLMLAGILCFGLVSFRNVEIR